MPSARSSAQNQPKPTKATKSAKQPPRLSRQRKPQELTAEDWQRGLRRQFGQELAYTLVNLGAEPVFSDFHVGNPQSGRQYTVTVRGLNPGDNRCTCADFAGNGLGTCKHIEFTLARLRAQRGAKAAFKRGHALPFSEIVLQEGPQRGLRWLPGAACPPDLQRKAAALFSTSAAGTLLLPPERIDAIERFLQDVRSAAADGLADGAADSTTDGPAACHAVRIDPAVLGAVAELRDAQQRQRTLAAAYPNGPADPALVALLKTPLYPYQAEGALFAARAGRALLADEMGLGKTVQALAAAELMARHFGVQRVLVVCPTSLKHQWHSEVQRFCGRQAQVLQGPRGVRQQQYREENFCKITHYEAIARDLDLISAWAPDLLILDEAQRVKNWNTIAARALRRIATPYAIVLSGTPLENRLEELIAIVQLVDQHRLGPSWRLLLEHQRVDDSGRVVGYQALDRIGHTLAPVMLRRRKAQVLQQLPERLDKTLLVPLTPEQRAHHDENGEAVRRIVQRWRKTGYLSDADQHRLQCALQNMRMACDSTWLLDKETDHGTKADELMQVLDELLAEPNSKAVLFSQWRGMHEVVQRRLHQRGWGHVLFHGGVPAEQRSALVQRFHQDADCRLFLSTDAGGVGLNLQHAAATVINLDLPWNPAVLEQRIGRVHRLGQQRGVRVINLVAEGSIEHGMLGVLAFKKSLFAGVLDGGESDVFMQGTKLSKFMESVDAVTQAMPAAGAPDDDKAEAGAGATVQAIVDAPQTADADIAAAPSASPAAAPRGAAPTPDPWFSLLDAGLALLKALRAGSAAAPRIDTDPATGQPFLKLPLPQPETLQQLLAALDGLRSPQRDQTPGQ